MTRTLGPTILASPSEDPGLPCYVVLFESDEKATEPYSPIVPLGQGSMAGTKPHGFHTQVATVLDLLEYVLHLPRSFTETVDASPEAFRQVRKLEVPQHVFLCPYPMVLAERFLTGLRAGNVSIILAPKSLEQAANALRSDIAPGAEVAISGSLDSALIRRHWQHTLRMKGFGETEDIQCPPLLNDPTRAPLLLPTEFLQIRMGVSSADLSSLRSSTDDLQRAVHFQRVLSTIARLDRRGVSMDEGRAEFDKELEIGSLDDRYPIVIAAPGVPSRYWTKTRRALKRMNPGARIPEPDPGDEETENRVFDFVVAHSALARSGVGIRLDKVPDSAFRSLATLEDLWRSSTAPQPRKVWKLLASVSEQCATLLGGRFGDLYSNASQATVFSSFPLGLATMPGDSAPLCARTPIAYRHTFPLTRALQFELGTPFSCLIGFSPRVLVIECLSREDRIWRTSQMAWEVIAQTIHGIPGASLTVSHVGNVNELLSALEGASRYDVLILSAHGNYDPRHNAAGIVVGKSLVQDLEGGELPPLVFLSACQVAPRGIGSVNIADLLMRRGAQAVIAPLVPIDVEHNAMLMVRFFIYLNEWRGGQNGDQSVAAAWHHVTTSNAVHDVLRASRWLGEWGESSEVLEDFMLKRSPGRVRLPHLYDDVVAVLGEIADDHGVRQRFDRTVSECGFAPESLLYVVLGRPERIMIRHALMQSIWDEKRGAAASNDGDDS